jgi:cytochrome b pre-mRNA-processing protein 3
MRSLMAMLRPKAPDAGALYDAVVAEARRPAWYREGGVADSLDGRFAVLSSLAALAILRLENGDEDAVRHSVALTESFIADMDAQMREVGFGDPSIGKQVRGMVGALASRVDWWPSRGRTAPPRRRQVGRPRMAGCGTPQRLSR